MISIRIVRFVPLLFPLLLVSATCITDVRRHGATGPWVGEITNYGNDTIASVYVNGRIEDATRRTVTYVQAYACPSQLAPGERATFEVFPQDIYTPDGQPPPVAPFEFVPDPGIQGYPVDTQSPGDPYSAFTGEGLTTKLVSKDPVRRFALVEMTNESPFTYQNIVVCANLRTPSGTLAEVGSTNFLPGMLRPGATKTFPIFFNSMPEGTVEFFPRGVNYCCASSVTLKAGTFSVTATRVVDNGTALRVVGEMRNDTGLDLVGATVSAHVDGSWADRIDQQTLACNGWVPDGAAAPVAFTLPLAPGTRSPTVAIEDIAAYQGGSIYAPPVTGVTAVGGPRSTSGLATKRVSATISNPTTAWIALEGVCLSLRDARGRLVGTAASIDNLPYNDRYLAPGAHLRVTADVEELDRSTTAEAAAYGQPTYPPAPPVAITDSDFGGVVEGPEDPALPRPDY